MVPVMVDWEVIEREKQDKRDRIVVVFFVALQKPLLQSATVVSVLLQFRHLSKPPLPATTAGLWSDTIDADDPTERNMAFLMMRVLVV